MGSPENRRFLCLACHYGDESQGDGDFHHPIGATINLRGNRGRQCDFAREFGAPVPINPVSPEVTHKPIYQKFYKYLSHLNSPPPADPFLDSSVRNYDFLKRCFLDLTRVRSTDVVKQLLDKGYNARHQTLQELFDDVNLTDADRRSFEEWAFSLNAIRDTSVITTTLNKGTIDRYLPEVYTYLYYDMMYWLLNEQKQFDANGVKSACYSYSLVDNPKRKLDEWSNRYRVAYEAVRDQLEVWRDKQKTPEEKDKFKEDIDPDKLRQTNEEKEQSKLMREYLMIGIGATALIYLVLRK